MSYQGFGKASGPTAPPKLQHSFGNSPPPVSDSPPVRPPSQHEALSSRVQSYPMAFPTTGTASSLHHQYNSGPGATVRMRSPSFAFENPRSVATASYSYPSAGSRGPILSPSRPVEGSSSFKAIDAQSHPSRGIASAMIMQNSDNVVGEVAHLHTKRTRSPTYVSGDEKLPKIAGHPVIRRPVSPSPTFADQPKVRGIHVNSQAYQDQSSSERFYDHDTNILTGFGNVHGPKRTKSPEKPFVSDLRSAQTNLQRPVSPSPTFADQPKVRGIHVNSQAYQDQSPSEQFYDHDTNILTGFGNVHGPKRTKSPEKPFVSDLRFAQTNLQRPVSPSPTFADQPKVRGIHVNSQAYQNQSPSERFYDHDTNILTGFGNVHAPKRTKSPEKPFVSDLRLAQTNLQRPVSPSPTFADQPKVRGIHVNSQAYQDQSPSERFYDHDTNILTGFGNVHAPKRTKSPEKPFVSDLRSAQTNLQRPSISPPRSFSRSNAHEVMGSMRNVYSESVATKPTSVSIPQRTRSPPLPSLDQASGGNSHTTYDDTERERLAKAKRLARFKDELVEVAHNNSGSVDVRDNTNKNEHLTAEKNKYMSNQSSELSGNLAHGNSFPDYETLESSSIIIGLCPDMCPESERASRERKGDLDYYERLDGDRNHTDKLLAVKKYTRTAEREANLIRPMPVLLKTIDYLLDLLSQPYDETFLGIYNFLWDRMRAIRMDLRMQHLFNENAITMLEHMIRLHIIAMHELCEFSKGEGFAEGFDAHLNIEQMNKTSVELFQMYDDHRKRGITVPSEKEFRGYYALLKLDKHPGYKVEPAELSLDLAKMTPEMRQTPEVKFARDVARACRTSNFIAFFRLVRKASYLQACLMHAHFAKLRTQALASLHCGVQNNQGLPIAHVRKWIGMEEEDIEGLLEYHGFSIKEFEEPYMVREGPFLNSDKDFATKCSKLVHMKRSKMIVNDVLPRSKNEYLITGATKPIPLTRSGATKPIPLTRSKKESQTFSFGKISSPRTVSTEKGSSMRAIDEEMTEFDDQLIPVDHKQVQPMTETPKVGQLLDYNHNHNHEADDALLRQSSPRSCEPLRTEVKFVGNQGYDGLFMTSPVGNISTGMRVSSPLVSDVSLQNISVCGYNDNARGSVEPQSLDDNVTEDEEILYATQENKHDIAMESCQGEEIANARLKLILRLWRRRALKKKQLREQRLLAAKAAFNTLSVGPPVQLHNHKIKTVGVFDIDDSVRERWKKQKLSWSVVNVSEVVASILSRRNVDGKCICWKLVVCSQMDNAGDLDQRTQDSRFAAGSWLLSKLMPSKANDLVFSSSFLSIWKSWLSDETGVDLSCFLSIVKDANFDNLPQTVHGASAILFVATQSISLDLQRIQLHKLLMSIPSGSCLPLLILSDLHNEVSASAMLANRLGLYDIDKSRIRSFQVVSLLDNPHLRNLGFFSDEKLKEGLKWLANESPSQPVLHCVKVLDLIITHLHSSMDMLDSMKDKDVSPNHCISAFNLALDQSLVDITAAVKENPSNWPCLEIGLLESCDEHTITTHALPPVGWSSVENVEPLKQALMDLKLPTFPDISWLTKGSNMVKEIPTRRDNLASCLSCYLTQTSEIMGQQLAMEEAHIMLQKCAKLELRKFNYFIVPRWTTIFRRIFNWRLRYFAGRSSYVHIVDCCHDASLTSSIRLESREPPLYRFNQPLLDEVIEVACSALSIDHGRQLSEVHQPLAAITSNSRPHEVFVATNDFADDDTNSTRQIGFVSSDSVPNFGQELNCTEKEPVTSGTVYSEAAKLNGLLDQCNKLQDAIEKKLSVYF